MESSESASCWVNKPRPLWHLLISSFRESPFSHMFLFPAFAPGPCLTPQKLCRTAEAAQNGLNLGQIPALSQSPIAWVGWPTEEKKGITLSGSRSLWTTWGLVKVSDITVWFPVFKTLGSWYQLYPLPTRLGFRVFLKRNGAGVEGDVKMAVLVCKNVYF